MEAPSSGTKLKLLTGVVVGYFVVFFMVMAIMIPITATAILLLKNPFIDFAAGISCKIKSTPICDIRDELKDNIDKKDLEWLRKNVEHDLRIAMDCANATPQQRKENACIKGLLTAGEDEAEKKPIPPSQQWLIPVYQKASAKYKVPWELIAAVNATKSHYGDINCAPASDRRVGFMNIRTEYWAKHRVNAGYARTTRNGPCANSVAPAQYMKDDRVDAGSRYSNPYDAVDAIYSVANGLRKSGVKNEKEWEYSGSPSDFCTAEKHDGKIFYQSDYAIADDGAGDDGTGTAGFNSRLDIPRDVVDLALKYRSDKGKYKPRRDPDSNRSPMPKDDIVRMLRAAWVAFGAKGDKLTENVTKNYAQIISRESGGRPYILQGYIGDVNDNNPAGGLFQFIPGTFKTWKVDGYNDLFNPFDNILAAVNAQVNSGMGYVLDGHSGWGPGSGANPYKTGGKVKEVAGDGGSGNEAGSGPISTPDSGESSKPHPYEGSPQNDATSKAVAVSGYVYEQSPCYVAVVHDWYATIKQQQEQDDAVMEEFVSQAEDTAEKLDGKPVGFALVDEEGNVITEHDSEKSNLARSTSKAMVLVALTRMRKDGALTATEKSLATNMIERSDNAAANKLYEIVGINRINKVAKDAKMKQWKPETKVFDSYKLERSKISALDLAKLFAKIDMMIPKRHRAFSREILSNIKPPGNYGALNAGIDGGVLAKGGWFNEKSGWTVNQGAQIPYKKKKYGFGVVLGEQKSFEQGQKATKELAEATMDDLRSGAVGGKGYAGIVSWANYLDKSKIPYCYGGGHGITPAKPSGGQWCVRVDKSHGPGNEKGLDCSSSTSFILQKSGFKLPTMVSGSFGNWGEPGEGKQVTIYSNPGHVFLKIGNRMFGTSVENYRNGPGWVSTRSTAGFVKSHPPGL